MASVMTCRVHPVALLSIVDAYERRSSKDNKAIGALLGKQNNNKTTTTTINRNAQRVAGSITVSRHHRTPRACAIRLIMLQKDISANNIGLLQTE